MWGFSSIMPGQSCSKKRLTLGASQVANLEVFLFQRRHYKGKKTFCLKPNGFDRLQTVVVQGDAICLNI
jgi:hypothetical protein